MPTYKDEKTGTWYCKFYYKDYTGTKKQKMKRGFTLQRDAKDWERDFLIKHAAQPSMPFRTLAELYLEDKKSHYKLSTYETKKNRVEKWLLPFFSDKAVDAITPADIRKWQADLKESKGANDKPLSPGYMQNLVTELSSMFNFAVRLYGLSVNPCQIAGNTVGKKARSLNFWTKEEFDRFIDTFDRADPFYTAFLVLYYTGMRIGELMALTFADIDLKAGTISINKTYHKINGRTVITPPKTEKGNRTITIPRFLCVCLDRHMKRIYGATKETRVFQSSKDPYLQHMKKHEALAGLRHIRLHDLRHSHASLLIELGFSALLVSERLGHENVSTTLDIYSHLFPSKQSEVADKLDKLYSSDNY